MSARFQPAEAPRAPSAPAGRTQVRCWRCEFQNGIAAHEKRGLVYCEWCDAPLHTDGRLPSFARRLWFLVRSRLS